MSHPVPKVSERPPPPPDRLAALRRVPRETLEREQARRARLRAELLDHLPHPDVPWEGDIGGDRAESWPPPPVRPPRPARRGRRRFSREVFAAWLAEFAAARGPDFSQREFAQWAGVGASTVSKRCGSWAATRASAGLPPEPTGPPRRLRTLHRLLCVLHATRGRSRPLTGRELARLAAMTTENVKRHGGIAHLHYLYRLWVSPKTRRTGPPPPGPDEYAPPPPAPPSPPAPPRSRRPARRCGCCGSVGRGGRAWGASVLVLDAPCVP